MDENLKNLEVILAAMKQDHLGKADFAREFMRVIELVKSLKTANQQAMAAINERIGLIASRMKDSNSKDIEQSKTDLKEFTKGHLEQTDKLIFGKIKEIDSKLKEIKNGEDGKDADEQLIANRVSEAIKKPIIDEIEKDLPNLGEAVRDGLELLDGDQRLDKSAIRGLDELIEEIRKIASSKGGVGGGLSRGVADGLYAPLGSLGGDFEVESGTIAAGTTEYTFLNEISKVYSFNVGSQYIQPSVYTVEDDTVTIEAADATGWDGLAYTLIYKKA